MWASKVLNSVLTHLKSCCLTCKALPSNRLWQQHLLETSATGNRTSTGRILNVAVCPADTNEPPRVLNYLSAPNVLVWSAVSCSSAFPFLFMPQDLLARNSRGELVK